mmetsp:Transcript_3231/g.6657  ORF Transcript_3231/g.6657 Transcript_3231/m.6657 type:complete len:293 (-) Transcript_3231:2-880(-)
MKASLVALLSSLAWAIEVSQELVDQVNAAGKWGTSLDWVNCRDTHDLMQFVGSVRSPTQLSSHYWGNLLSYVKIPASFDTRDHWPGCVNPVDYQINCGGCWDLVASDVFADRLCVKNRAGVIFASHTIPSCNPALKWCKARNLDSAWRNLSNKGIGGLPCQGLIDENWDESSICPNPAESFAPPTFFQPSIAKLFNDPTSIKLAIMVGGPASATIDVYEDLFIYSSGVYEHVAGEKIGAQAVKLIGWGVEDGKDYWIASNSWGQEWGEQGFFKIAFGQCGVDTEVVAGEASL